MLNELRQWLILALVGLALILATLGVSRCSKTFQQPTIGPRIDSIIVERTDTLLKLDTILKKKVIYRDTGRIEYIHDDLDKSVPPIGNENIMIAENQLRECMKCKDSLEAYKQIVAVDSGTIDTLSKLAKNKEAPPTLIDDAKKVGLGILIGITLKSLF